MTSNAGSPPATATAATPVDVKPILSRQPSLCMKPAQTPPAASPSSTSSSAPLSLTSKEWIIPPRPKPGRKPATDTPPTKRKAQNRAAQRAFRERRAARVGELEEHLKQVEEEHEHEQELLRRTIEKLEKEVEQYRVDLVNWMDRCHQLEGELAALKSTPAAPRSSQETTSQDEPPASADTEINDNAVGCGNCTLDTRCQCIDDAFTAMGGEAATLAHQQEKRPHSPAPAAGEKRIKLEPEEAMEIDFTAVYASKHATGVPRPEDRSPTSAVADPCGFCTDGTPCICAEMAAEQEQVQEQATSSVNTSRPTRTVEADPPRQLDQFTPPPSEGDVSISIPAAGSPDPGCASGPGTCAQCRTDPNSTLFCKSLAASRAQAANARTGCGGAPTPGASYRQSQDHNDSAPLPARTTRSRAAAGPFHHRTHLASGVTLTCADAYTTLSRHPAYERASGDIANWLPKLHASDANPTMVGRPALEIDAANVMAVLKDFDRRFGQNC
ncbi:uncharacterized protein Z518_00296 [Rhinocladiella mackenziei CBS 650.93]|uniref:Rhinocladiella mackenziei CBS 650.93 unplaced genomic scaffold supercont1.1, whole genome shotgun sequence n=1 Tax=Rhinocladiella mackenziei CBS 650.93 TaxID=1442369 RepID=A0A0D2G3N4_9EURO|nr:uncharacterized protein Z518_00296 [Rhinocladiella mackenziei CBS 650.93]KIX09217.1 hypothetical protein Z518_00296 [Rhinocladiella mackenziei CBS 650.93]